jgi:hypothetical protein
VDNLPLRDAFFNPSFFTDDKGHLEDLLRGMASQQAQEIDTLLVDDVRNFLFGPPGAGGLDLASLNIQRGRDHGLPDYNVLRVAYGLEPAQQFSDISSDPAIQAGLTAVYGSVDNIDGWVGGLAEDHIAGASVGELVHTVLADQFARLRDGDRFFYLNDPDLSDLAITDVIDLNSVTLAEVIRLNTKINGIQDNVFFVNGAGAPSQASLAANQAVQGDAGTATGAVLQPAVNGVVMLGPAETGRDGAGQQPAGDAGGPHTRDYAGPAAAPIELEYALWAQAVDQALGGSYGSVGDSSEEEDSAFETLFGRPDGDWWWNDLFAVAIA